LISAEVGKSWFMVYGFDYIIKVIQIDYFTKYLGIYFTMGIKKPEG
jgi:hypothetical protein